MHAIRYKEYKKENDKWKYHYFSLYHKCKYTHYSTYSHQTKYYEMNQSLMGKEFYLGEVFLNLFIPVTFYALIHLTAVIQQFINIF